MPFDLIYWDADYVSSEWENQNQTVYQCSCGSKRYPEMENLDAGNSCDRAMMVHSNFENISEPDQDNSAPEDLSMRTMQKRKFSQFHNTPSSSWGLEQFEDHIVHQCVKRSKTVQNLERPPTSPLPTDNFLLKQEQDEPIIISDGEGSVHSQEPRSTSLIEQASKSTQTVESSESDSPRLDEVVAKLEEMEEKFNTKLDMLFNVISSSENGSSPNMNSPGSLISQLPLDTKEDCEEFTEKLTTDESNKNKLIEYLSFLGGSTPHKSVYAQLGKLFTDELASKYSVIGRAKSKMAIANTVLHECIIASIKKRFPNSSLQEINKSIGQYLTCSPERLKRRSK